MSEQKQISYNEFAKEMHEARIGNESMTSEDMHGAVVEELAARQTQIFAERAKGQVLADKLARLIDLLPVRVVYSRDDFDSMATMAALSNRLELAAEQMGLLRKLHEEVLTLSRKLGLDPCCGETQNIYKSRTLIQCFLLAINKGRRPIWLSRDETEFLEEILGQKVSKERVLSYPLWSRIPLVKKQLHKLRDEIDELKTLIPKKV